MMRNATEMREDDRGGAVEMQDNGGGIKGQRRRRRQTSTVEEIRDNKDGYGGRGDTGRQQKICGTTEMTKWVGRTATEWKNLYRGRLPTRGRIISLIN